MFTAIKIHLEFARDVCDHMNDGKEYETACRRFLTLTLRYVDDAYNAPLIVVIAVST